MPYFFHRKIRNTIHYSLEWLKSRKISQGIKEITKVVIYLEITTFALWMLFSFLTTFYFS